MILKSKIWSLRKHIVSLNTLFSKRQIDLWEIVQINYIANEKVAKHSKHYSISEFVKEWLLAVTEVLFLEKLNMFDKISLSHRTISSWRNCIRYQGFTVRKNKRIWFFYTSYQQKHRYIRFRSNGNFHTWYW